MYQRVKRNMTYRFLHRGIHGTTSGEREPEELG